MATVKLNIDEALEDLPADVVGRFVKDLLAKARGSSIGQQYTFLRDRDLLLERGILPPDDLSGDSPLQEPE